MFRLIRAEYRYNGLFNLSMLVFIPIVTAFLSRTDETDFHVAFIIFGFFIAHVSTVYAMREKRERLNMLLPVPSVVVAASRVLLVILPFLAGWILFVASLAVCSNTVHGFSLPLLAFMGLYLLGFSVFIAIRDIVRNFHAASISRTNLIRVSAVFLLFGLTVMSLVGTIRVSGGGEIPVYIRVIGAVFDVLFSCSGAVGLYIVTGVLYVVSIFTFMKRKSYL